MDNMSLSDIAAIMPKSGNGDGFLEGNGIIILILFFLKYDALKREYDQALAAISNATQTQNILSSLGRYVTNPPLCGGFNGYGYYPGATLQ